MFTKAAPASSASANSPARAHPTIRSPSTATSSRQRCLAGMATACACTLLGVVTWYGSSARKSAHRAWASAGS